MGFVLLSSPEFVVERFRAVLREDWGIECPEDAANPRSERDGIALAFEVNGMMATVGLMEAKVPGGEAEYWANSNFMTREASIAAAKAHQAHLLVAVLGRGHAPLEAGELFVKVACACLKAPNVLGIYDCGTVWMPEHFMESAMVMKEGSRLWAIWCLWDYIGMRRGSAVGQTVCAPSAERSLRLYTAAASPRKFMI